MLKHKNLIIVALLVVLAAGAYLIGWRGEHRPRVACETELATTRTSLASAETRVRLAELLGAQLALSDAVSERNFGQAMELSSHFFDNVSAELGRVSQPDHRDALEAVLGARDSVTAALTRGDAGTPEILRRIQLRLRDALDYPTTPPPAALPAATPAPPAASPAATPAPPAG